MIEHFFDRFEAPFRLVWIYVDDLERRLVVYGMSTEIPEVADRIDRLPQLPGERLQWIGLFE